MPDQLDLSKRLLNMGAGSREESGLGNRKQNVEEYEKAVSGPADMPKANPPQKVDKIHPGAKYGDKPPEKRINVDQYIKPLGSFEHGTDYVPKTGLALLHKGEKVIPAKDNMADSHVFDMIPGKKEKAPPKHIKEIRTTRAHDGKLIHTHIHHHPAHHPDETHVSNDMSDLHNHFEDHAGTPNDGEEAPAGGAPAPLTAAAPPMPAPAAPAGPTAV
jgi:hypothetical protein